MLNKLLLIISKIQHDIENPSINKGGCVHFAYFLSRALRRYGYKHHVVAMNKHVSFSDPEASLQELLNYEDGCSHLAVYIPKIGYIDAEKIVKNPYDFYHFKVATVKLPADYDLNKLRKKPYWNPEYQKNYNKKLTRIISENFKQLKYERRY